MENKLTKADIVKEISTKTKMREEDVQMIMEEFMKVITRGLAKGANVYLRGFGTFYLKKRAQKIGRDIKANKSVVIPEHYIPAYKPPKQLVEKVKKLKVVSSKK
ncbi:MAG: integration host factor subunit beta [Bacteroidia bacterium]|nr:MAG: integration host factor subunit beta [Bacteroidia bacterium]